jgi:hypothetical protein
VSDSTAPGQGGGQHRGHRTGGVAHQVRWLCQQPGHQGRVGVEILTRTDPLAAPVAGPVDNLQREAVSQLQLLAPAQLAGQHAAVQQHYPRSPAGNVIRLAWENAAA